MGLTRRILDRLNPVRSLYGRIAILTSLLVFVLIGSTAVLVERNHRDTIVSERKKRAVELATSLATESTNDLLSYNYVALEQAVSGLSQRPDVLYGIILDKEGAVAADSLGGALTGKTLDDPIARRAAATREPLIQEYWRDPGRELVYDVAVPVLIDDSKQKWGVVRIGISLASMRRELTRSRVQIALLGVLGALLGSGASLLLARGIVTPIQKLARGADAVGKGDLSQHIDVPTQDELGHLAEAFNEMTRKLARMRELEDQLQRSMRLAALGTLAAGIAHDVQNPLGTVRLICEGLAERPDDPSIREKFNRMVPRELERVSRIIEDMMELARPSNMQLQPLDINGIVSQALDLYEPQCKDHNVEVQRALASNLPPALVDWQRIHRSFTNIIQNAIQAMPKGGILTVATARAAVASPSLIRGDPIVRDPAREFVRITFGDTGKGIPNDILARIFDPFFTTKGQGLGLGMAIAHRMIEDHGGRIEVSSEEGKGTTFAIYLPAATFDGSQAPSAPRTG